jgi:hypothetical protein
MTGADTISSYRASGASVFNAIVAIVHNRTGLDYSAAFNNVLADNADLMRASLDGPNHTGPLDRLLNRTESATGLGAVASSELAVGKVARLTSRFFPSLVGSPTALQWDVLSRAASQLEKCGIPLRLFNRVSGADVRKPDWKTANDRAGDILAILEDQESKSGDIGALESFQKMSPFYKWGTFKGQIDRLMKDESLSLSDAFARLKEKQPIFWTQAMLSFEPAK